MLGVVASLLFLWPGFCQAGQTAEFHRTLAVTLAEPVKLTVDLQSGDLEIAYSHDGQVSVSAIAQASGDVELDESYFKCALSVEQSGNSVAIRQTAIAAAPIKIRYRIDVPYRTEVTAANKSGNQTVRGVLGPVDLSSSRGDISVSYVPKAVKVQVETGNIDLQMIGDHVFAKSGRGNITGERLAKGVSAEAGDGDITLTVVGASEAIVKHGTGRIEIGGARESVVSSTDGGDVHVKAVPQSDWKLKTRSGAIRIELPPRAAFELDASTDLGRLQLEREDLPKLASDARQTQQKVNGGGGKKIEARTESGTIVIR